VQEQLGSAYMLVLRKIKLTVKDRIMDKQQILYSIISRQLGIPEGDISLDSNFMDDLGADSLDTIEIVLCLEEEFNIEIPEFEIEQMFTVKSVLNYLKSLR
jgi:acyl carrier protein|tara:strand:- start:929 stop:1231 length:303 start_codon:yes stop_codon:yes gene_type:complete